jgi:curved DNA-binding protein CbpA
MKKIPAKRRYAPRRPYRSDVAFSLRLKDYYERLGVPRDAGQAAIKAAFHKLALRHHSDHGGSDEAFRLLREAEQTLIDSDRRAAYDAQLAMEEERKQQLLAYALNQSWVSATVVPPAAAQSPQSQEQEVYQAIGKLILELIKLALKSK